MTIDTTVLGTSKAGVPELAWSLAGDDDVLDFPDDPLEPGCAEQPLGVRYGWGAVCRRAVLLVVSGAAVAAGLVSAMPAPEVVPSAAPTSSSDSDPFVKEEEAAGAGPSNDPDVCAYIRAGNTPQQTAEAEMHNSSLTLAQARAYVDEAIRVYCPEISASAAHR